MANCGRCGRELKTQRSIDEGYGPVCKRKKVAEDAEFEKIQVTIDEVLEEKVVA